MDKQRSLAIKAILQVILSPIVFGALIFGVAGTLDYWQAWVFIAVFAVATAVLTVDLIKHDPALLERRMRVGPAAEQRPIQKLAVLLSFASFFLCIVVAALDHRYGWSHVPPWVVLLGECCVVLSYALFFWVMRENSFAAATIQLAQDQRVISTGPYAIVRHPMYSGGILLMIAIPLALGSYWGLLMMLAGSPTLLLRIVDEEKFLLTDLPGYADYRERVRYRLIPGLY